MNNYLSNLNWRYATKKFDSSKKLSKEQVLLLTEAVRLTPTSFGLMPYKVIVVENQHLKEQLTAKAYGQAQVSDSSHLFVFAAKTTVTQKYIEEFIEKVAKDKGMEVEALAAYKDMMVNFTKVMSPEQQQEWAAKQAYIGLGFLLNAAAQNQIDACPMEGFDPEGFDEVLGIKAQGLHSVVICPVGFRSAEDFLAKAKKFRLPETEIFISK